MSEKETKKVILEVEVPEGSIVSRVRTYNSNRIEAAWADFRILDPAQVVPDGWPTDEMVVRGAETLRDCGLTFEDDLRSTEQAQEIAKSVFVAMLAARPTSEARVEQPAPPTNTDMLRFAVDQWHAQVSQRPLQNVHRRTLDSVWRQVIKEAGGDPESLVGPKHDDFLDASGNPKSTTPPRDQGGSEAATTQPAADGGGE